MNVIKATTAKDGWTVADDMRIRVLPSSRPFGLHVLLHLHIDIHNSDRSVIELLVALSINTSAQCRLHKVFVIAVAEVRSRKSAARACGEQTIGKL